MISPHVEAAPTKFCTYEELVTGIDTLIDAGDIEISDMGSMNHSMGGEMDKNQNGNMQEPQNGDGFVPEMPQSEAAGETVRETENDNSDEQTQYAIKKQDKGDMPEDMNKKEDMSGRISASLMSVYIWVCISCGVLIFGILFAIIIPFYQFKYHSLTGFLSCFFSRFLCSLYFYGGRVITIKCFISEISICPYFIAIVFPLFDVFVYVVKLFI